MQRLRHTVLCALFCASAALSSATSARAFEAAVSLVALTAQLIGAVVQLSEAIAVLAAPSSKRTVCRIEAGERIQVLGYSDDRKWAKVKTQKGVTGWVPAHQLPRQPQPG